MFNAIKRGVVVGLGLFLQLSIILSTYLYLGDRVIIINFLYRIVGFLIVLWLMKNSKSYSYTLPWIVLILLFPIVGSLLYIIIGRNIRISKLYRNITASEKNMNVYLKQDKKIKQEIKNNTKLKYIIDFAGFPVSTNNDVEYYPLGEIAFEEILKELKKAKKFIFFEYFIVAPGKMWNSILEILKEKAKEGLDVRVMYDDFGCLTTLDSSYPKELENYGIKCIAFNKLHSLSGIIMNNRDHRKILVIDGKVAFSGGINIADEYINKKVRFGHWKDNGIKVSGDAVWSYTVLFLTMWNSFIKSDEDFNEFKYNFKSKEHTGYVAPYGETPLDNEIVGQDIYLNIINEAKKYVYICTPYLIIDTDMINALVLAAKKGVDVRIVIPGIPDKKITYTLSESYVEALVNGGVKIYTYTPGFVHAKVFVADDNVSTVGTINMDYRSLYLHFECGLYMEDVKCIKDIKKDMDDMISESRELSKEDVKTPFLKGVFQALLRLVAPLM